MTFLLLALVVGLIGVSVRLVVHAGSMQSVRLSLHLRDVQRYGYEPSVPAEPDSSRSRLGARIDLLARRIGRFVMARIPALTPIARGELTAAGFYAVSPEVIHGYRSLIAILLPGLILFYAVSTGAVSLTTLALVVAMAACGWLLPAVVVRRRGRGRLAKIDRDLPELIDLLVATVEAGMGFGGAIALVSDRFQGPLGDELRLTLRAQSLGMSNLRALEDMLERCDTPSIRTFVRTVTRGESMGVSIAPILRVLASDQRRRRRQAAEEKMQKAPVKMLFPLVLLIFPALMIVLLFPAAYSVLKTFSGGG